MTRIIIVAVLYQLIFFTIEFFYRRFQLKSESTRRVTHLVSGLLALLLPLWLDRNQIVVLAVLILLSLVYSRKNKIIRSIHAVGRPSWGEFFYPLAVAAAALMFLPSNQDFYHFAILVLAVSDPLANYFGTKYRSRGLVFDKTLAGSLVFFISALIISLFFLNFTAGLTVALVVTMTELLSPVGSDNLTIVLAIGVLSRLIK